MSASIRTMNRVRLPAFKRFDIPADRHGRRSTYVMGCKCDPCRDAEADYSAAVKRRRRST